MPVISEPVGQIQNFNQNTKKEKNKYSDFMITINTNKSYRVNDQHLQNDAEFLNKCIINLLRQPENILKLDGDYEDIKTFKSNYGIELGGKNKCLHAHIYIYTQHNINDLKIDAYEIKEYFKKMLGLSNLAVHVDSIKSNQYARDYVNKMNT